ncbi:hypothetical protein [Halothermothrix orenii]|uniref:hypothetical protein n=1 Tax=Halothermothrix orenii TaxID=31909 RepID=UPI001439739E|nr:hypothetical protein [Halothermothrix orenii]
MIALYNYNDKLMIILNVITENSNTVFIKIIQIFTTTTNFIRDGFNNLSQVFNNRELAIGFWLIVFIIFALSVKGAREQIPGLIKLLFNNTLYFGTLVWAYMYI